MAATSRDGGHEQIGTNSHSNSSSSSGTIVSTTNTSSTSLLSCSFSVEAALHLDMGTHDDEETGEWNSSEKRRMEHIKSLVQGFFGAPSANCSINGGDMSVLERWLADLGVGWVLHLADGASAGELEPALAARSWIQALSEIMESLRCTASLFPDRASVGLPSICEQQEEPEAGSPTPDQFHFALFIQETMLRMLAFVDVMVALDPNGVPALQQKINILLCVRGALSNALSDIDNSFLSTLSPEVELIGGEMLKLLRAKDGKAGDAIWSTLEEIRTRILDSVKDSSGTQTPQGSSDIHKVTLSVMGHISFLLDNYASMSKIVSKAASLGKYVPQMGDQTHLDSRIMEMASCLEDKLANMSESYPDKGLRFLFLLNNSELIRGRLQSNTWYSSYLQVHAAALAAKKERYMESYLRVSWAPVLSRLFNPTPLCLFGKYYYPPALPKFESEFQKMYTTQKLWKVPDPDLRTSLRTAITEKIIPGYTKHIEENNITTPRISPQELEGMLQELFEG